MLFLLRYIGGFLKKAALVLVVFGVAIGLLIQLGKPKSNTQIRPAVSHNQDVYDTLKDPKLQQTDEGKFRMTLYRITMCSMVGTACTDNPADETTNFHGSLFGKISHVFVSPFVYPPASGIGWSQQSLAKAGFIPQTLAAEGIGFAALRPFSSLWEISRNIAYTLMVLMIIIIGFMVMFRAKIDAQTVIGIENSLPRIVLSLLFITFSFPIIGFMIDLMYVLIGLGVSVLAPTDVQYTEGQLLNMYFAADLGTIWSGAMISEGSWLSKIPIFGPLWDLTRMGNAIVGLLPEFLNDAVKVSAAVSFAAPFPEAIAKMLNLDSLAGMFDNMNIFGNSLGRLPSGIIGTVARIGLYAVVMPFILFNGAGFIVGLLLLLTIIFLMFRIFFMLFMGYIRLLLYLIFFPLIAILDIIPGQNFSITTLKNIAAELLMFPITVYLLMVGKAITNVLADPGFNPTFDYGVQPTTWQPPFLYGIQPEHFSVLVGMGIIFLIPDLIKLVKEAMGVKGLPIQVGLGTYFAGAGAIAGGGMAGITQFGSLAQTAPGIRGLVLNNGLIKRIPGLNTLFGAGTDRGEGEANAVGAGN